MLVQLILYLTFLLLWFQTTDISWLRCTLAELLFIPNVTILYCLIYPKYRKNYSLKVHYQQV